jgi:hypothetical protein
MTTLRALTVSTAALAMLAAGTSTAGAAEVGDQETIRPPAKAPVTFPGTGKKRGEALRGKERVVSREITLVGRETVEFSLRCPRRTTHAGLGVRQGETDINFKVLRPRNYVGKRSVRVQGRGYGAGGEEVTGTIFALCR